MNIKNYTYITTNSKKVKENSIFVSIDNKQEYILEAIKNKASLIVSPQKNNLNINNLEVNNIKYFFSYHYQKINNINMNDFTVIGVTGTDGKTTIAKMLYDVITERYKALYIGTLGIIYDNEIIKTNNTTPDIETVLECFKIANDKKIKYIILEASSEGLLNKRLTGIKFDLVVFSNLSHEHLNTHKTMENYFNSKKKILKLLKSNGKLITNIEDEYGKKLSNKNSINYGLHKGKIRTLTFTLEKDNTKIFLLNNQKTYYYKIPFVGVYNIYNFLSVHAAISYLFNIDIFTFKNLKSPSGRFCVVNENIVIDFAHTPNALENLLLTIKEIYKDKDIILVLGSQGEKDKSKRKYLGKVANKYCKTIILTSEDPKNEAILDIILDISLGIVNTTYIIELNRKNAISKALELNNKSSVVVIVGKGLEDEEKHKNITYKHSDYQWVLKKVEMILPNS